MVNLNRNPGLTRPEMERHAADYCGASRVIWLGGEIAGDDTDGHIDQLARFVGPRPGGDRLGAGPGRRELSESLRELRAAKSRETDQDGRPLEVVPLPMPRPKHHDKQRLPASYANFDIANGVVIVPEFDDPADREAVSILAQLLPDREVIGLPVIDPGVGPGVSLHHAAGTGGLTMAAIPACSGSVCPVFRGPTWAR